VVVTLLLLVPTVTGLWLVTGGRTLDVARARVVAAAAAGTTLVLAVVVTIARPDVDLAWLPELGVRWSFGVDGIAVPLVLLTSLIGVLVAAHAWVDVPEGGTRATFLGCLLIVEAGSLATFTARDAVLFFVAFELVLVPMWVLISRFGDRHDERARTDAGHRFIFYTAVGSTLMLVGILALVTSAGTSDLRALAAGAGAALPAERQLLVAVLLVLGLSVKVPVFPLHTWLPPAHTTAPTAGSVLLAAVLLKMGTYGLVRLPVATVPDGFARLAPVLGVAGVIGIVWGALVCLVERDLKRLIAYSSVAHMGFVALALAAGSETGLQAALFANIAHGVISALLFFLVGGLKQRWGDVDLAVARPALRETSPRLGFLFILGLAASLGLPGLAGFWGEFFSVYAAWLPAADRPRALFVGCAVVAAIGAALAAGYALRVARTVWVGDRPDPGAAAATPDTDGVELVVLGVLGALVVLLGVLPGPLLAVTADAAALIARGGS
jgi:NADH-quinone oxidoreductase subunit M